MRTNQLRDFDKSFKQTAQYAGDREQFTVPTVDAGNVVVGQLNEDSATQARMYEKHPSTGMALLADTPSLVMVLADGTALHLTWNEAYNLGAALVYLAEVSYYG